MTNGDTVDELDRDAINGLLETGSRWRHGRFLGFEVERIGLDHGLSGRIYRLSGTTSAGPHTLIVKFESDDKIGRAVAFRTDNEVHLGRSIPASYGWRTDTDGQGVIAMEDVSPALQGDDLVGCSATQAEALIDLVARLHSLSWLETAGIAPKDPERWIPSAWETERWEDRLNRAGHRYPEKFTDGVVARLLVFDDEAHAASRQMAAGPVTWIHHDPHLDNVLWRGDGSPVLIDWSGAVIGPPAVDLAVLLMTLSLDDRSTLRPDDTLASYTAALHRHGVSFPLAQTREAASLGLRPLVRGLIGWAGFPGEEPQSRRLALRNEAVGRVITGLEWLDSMS